MAEFFRFRTIDALLGQFQELKEQTIYFASPDELNDPMEGLRDIVWNGDQIVWTNFFKHYIFCLNRSWLLLRLIDSSPKFDVNSIPIEHWDPMRFPREKNLLDDIWDRFCNLPHIQEIIEALANTKRKIRYSEVVFYLQTIQTCVLYNIIPKSYIDHRIISEKPFSRQFQEEADDKDKEGLKMLLNAIRGLEEYENQDALDAMFQVNKELHDDIRLTVEYNTRAGPPETLDIINRSVMIDFPKVYVEQLGRLLWPKWYTACFTGSYHNSSVWAKYADGHKGACLIFETVKEDNSNSLKLNQKNSNSFRTTLFREVHYADKLGEIDFFRTICRTTVSTLMELWYTDENGNTSECAAYIGSDSDEAARKELYWNNFFRDVTFKTKDWKYEQEYRLILEDTLSQYNEKDDRKLSYDFNSLKGIIFGIRTSKEDMVKIIEIIEEKKRCAGNNQTNFTYFQAYYSAKDGDIRAREIQLR